MVSSPIRRSKGSGARTGDGTLTAGGGADCPSNGVPWLGRNGSTVFWVCWPAVSFAVLSPGVPSSLFGADGDAAPSVGTGAGATILGAAGDAGVPVAGGAGVGAFGATFDGVPATGKGTVPCFGTPGDPAAPPGFGAPGFGIAGDPAAIGAFGAIGAGAA